MSGRRVGHAARVMAVLGPFGLGRPRRPAVDANGSMPDRADLFDLGWSLDAVPFAHVTGRTNIDTLTLGYSLDGVPFIGVSA